jgi:hypothetical protein
MKIYPNNPADLRYRILKIFLRTFKVDLKFEQRHKTESFFFCLF